MALGYNKISRGTGKFLEHIRSEIRFKVSVCFAIALHHETFSVQCKTLFVLKFMHQIRITVCYVPCAKASETCKSCVGFLMRRGRKQLTEISDFNS